MRFFKCRFEFVYEFDEFFIIYFGVFDYYFLYKMITLLTFYNIKK